VLGLQDDPLVGELALQDGVEEVLASGRLLVRRERTQHQGGARRGEGVGVDLAMRVTQGHTDLRTPVLETEDLLNGGQMRQLRRPVGPCVQDEPRLLLREVGEGGVVVRGEADDLTAPRVAGQRGETVLEDHGVVRRVRDLTQPLTLRGTQRALVRGRVVDAPLSVRGDGHGVAEQRIPTNLGRGDSPLQRTPVHGVADGVVAQVVVDELATVGQPGRGLLHRWTPSLKHN